MKVWIRTCQECGHKQKAKEPKLNEVLSDNYRNSACRKCKSEALDYGSEMEISDIIKQSSEQRRKDESDWFNEHAPIKEFQIKRENSYVQYGVWDSTSNEDFLVFFKSSPESKYSFQHKIVIEKEIVRELYKLLEN